MAKKRISRTREQVLADAKALGMVFTYRKRHPDITSALGYTFGKTVRVDDPNDATTAWVECSNCGGTGDYPSSMIPAGKCRFYCWENRSAGLYGKMPVDLDKYVKREQARDRREAKWAAGQAKRDADKARREAEIANRIDNLEPSLVTLADEYGLNIRQLDVIEPGRDSDFARKLIQGWIDNGSLSERQWEWVNKLLDRAEAAKHRQIAPSGRVVITGEVIKEELRSGYVPGSTEHKMTVKTDEGWLTWGSVPSKAYGLKDGGVQKGDRVSFTATVTPSDTDEFFSFYKRPSKFSLL